MTNIYLSYVYPSRNMTSLLYIISLWVNMTSIYLSYTYPSSNITSLLYIITLWVNMTSIYLSYIHPPRKHYFTIIYNFCMSKCD